MDGVCLCVLCVFVCSSSLAGDRGGLLPTRKGPGKAKAQVPLAVPRGGGSGGSLGGSGAGQRCWRSLGAWAGSGFEQHRAGEAQAG